MASSEFWRRDATAGEADYVTVDLESRKQGGDEHEIAAI
jgi:hypothetical protein